MTPIDRDRSADADALYGVIRLVRPLFKTIPMRGLMECLADAGPRTVPQLARLLMLKRQVVQRMVNELVDAGFGEAAVNEAHARSSLIRLTDAGRAAFATLRAVEHARTAPVAATLSAADVDACRRVMTALITAYGNPEGEPHEDR